jgi:hypothetical protein
MSQCQPEGSESASRRVGRRVVPTWSCSTSACDPLDVHQPIRPSYYLLVLTASAVLFHDPYSRHDDTCMANG